MDGPNDIRNLRQGNEVEWGEGGAGNYQDGRTEVGIIS